MEDIQGGLSKPLHEMILSSDDEILNQISSMSVPNRTHDQHANRAYGHRKGDEMDDDEEDDDEDEDEDDYDDQLA